MTRDTRPTAEEYEYYLRNLGQPCTITAIDWDSFPEDCQPHIGDDDLPCEVNVPLEGQYRTDAAQGGLLVHSPYCPYCYPQD